MTTGVMIMQTEEKIARENHNGDRSGVYLAPIPSKKITGQVPCCRCYSHGLSYELGDSVF